MMLKTKEELLNKLEIFHEKEHPKDKHEILPQIRDFPLFFLSFFFLIVKIAEKWEFYQKIAY